MKKLKFAKDRLSTAKALSVYDKRYLVSAEVFGKGLDIWLRSYVI